MKRLEDRSNGASRSARRKRGQGEASVYQLEDGSWRGAMSQGLRMPRKYFRGRTAEEVRRKIRTAQAMLDGGLALPNEALTVKMCFEALA